LVTFPRTWHSVISVVSAGVLRRWKDAVWDAGLRSPALLPREGSKDGAELLDFTLAGSNPVHSESFFSVPAGEGRKKLATRSRK